jgi:hypothetical protein
MRDRRKNLNIGTGGDVTPSPAAEKRGIPRIIQRIRTGLNVGDIRIRQKRRSATPYWLDFSTMLS